MDLRTIKPRGRQ